MGHLPVSQKCYHGDWKHSTSVHLSRCTRERTDEPSSEQSDDKHSRQQVKTSLIVVALNRHHLFEDECNRFVFWNITKACGRVCLLELRTVLLSICSDRWLSTLSFRGLIRLCKEIDRFPYLYLKHSFTELTQWFPKVPGPVRQGAGRVATSARQPNRIRTAVGYSPRSKLLLRMNLSLTTTTLSPGRNLAGSYSLTLCVFVCFRLSPTTTAKSS